MSTIAVNEITDEVGTGAPAFPNGMSVTGAALTDPEITGGVYLGGTGSANYLDDYEEGTWTPEYLSQSGSFATITYDTSVTSGKYIKIGTMVFIEGRIDLSALNTSGASGLLYVGSLPFASHDPDNGSQGVINISSQNGWNNIPQAGTLIERTTTFRLEKNQYNASRYFQITPGDMDEGDENRIVFSGCYITE